jgi:hypothetical protein
VTRGWAYQSEEGEKCSMQSFEDKLLEPLLRIQQVVPELFPGAVNVTEDFHLGRSHHRDATSRATAAGVTESDIDWNNRWNIGADASVLGPMRVLYEDRTQQIETFIRFSAAL